MHRPQQLGLWSAGRRTRSTTYTLRHPASRYTTPGASAPSRWSLQRLAVLDQWRVGSRGQPTRSRSRRRHTPEDADGPTDVQISVPELPLPSGGSGLGARPSSGCSQSRPCTPRRRSRPTWTTVCPHVCSSRDRLPTMDYRRVSRCSGDMTGPCLLLSVRATTT